MTEPSQAEPAGRELELIQMRVEDAVRKDFRQRVVYPLLVAALITVVFVVYWTRTQVPEVLRSDPAIRSTIQQATKEYLLLNEGRDLIAEEISMQLGADNQMLGSLIEKEVKKNLGTARIDADIQAAVQANLTTSIQDAIVSFFKEGQGKETLTAKVEAQLETQLSQAISPEMIATVVNNTLASPEGHELIKASVASVLMPDGSP